MAKTSTIHMRIDPELKMNAELLLNQLGLTTSDAINIFLTSLFFLLKILEFLIETVLARPYKQRHRWMAQTPMSCLKCLIDQ